jgi:small subunit ribosomal protein S4
MSRYLGAKSKIIRRLGKLPGLTTKDLIKKNKKRQKPGPYAIRLEEKQKLKFNYGITEKQLVNYMKRAKNKTGDTGIFLMQFLEMRLDSVMFRLGFNLSIGSSRQMINHHHVLVNNNCVSIPSYECKSGDVLQLKPSQFSQNLIKNNLEKSPITKVPNHLYLNKANFVGKVIESPQKDSSLLTVNTRFIIEFYSRRI